MNPHTSIKMTWHTENKIYSLTAAIFKTRFRRIYSPSAHAYHMNQPTRQFSLQVFDRIASISLKDGTESWITTIELYFLQI